MFSIDSLNDLQKKIALDTEGAILVSAGAGSGKTRLLTHRIVYLIEELNVSPSNILAITFTNKATNEMKERIAQMTTKSNVWISTFHAMCAKILRDNIYHLDGYNRYFTIYDTSDRAKVLKRIAKKINYEDYEDFDKRITEAKNEGLRPYELLKIYTYLPEIDTIVKGYLAYEEELKNNNALDFDDLLMKTLILFEEFPQVLEFYQDMFKYILVDEFQDTNTIQYKLVKMLSQKHGNIFVVGDEDQCIYGWRGANISNIRNFIKEYENTKVYKLEQNYRSTKNIINGANKLIKNNTTRIDKTLFTENPDGDNIIYYQAENEYEEAEYVVQKIISLMRQGIKSKDIAILMRMAYLSNLYEIKLLNYDINANVKFKFFERLEIKNILAYFSIIVNPKDNHSLMRIINYPTRGIGQVTIDKLLDVATNNELSIMEILEDIDNYEFGRAKAKLKEFANLIKNIKESYKMYGITDFAKNLIKITGIESYYNDFDKEDENRKKNIETLINHINYYEENNNGDGLADYIQSVTLQNDMMNSDSTDMGIDVYTIHDAKGLEYDYVFLIGLEEGIFPSRKAIDDKYGGEDKLEEERRLMYVAITRAKKKLYITRAKNRRLYGGEDNKTVESRFLREMELSKPQERAFKSFDNYQGNYGYKGFGGGQFEFNKTASYSTEKFKPATFDSFMTHIKPVESKKEEKEEVSTEMKVGALVLHPKFGTGNVIKIEGSGDNKFVTIDFKTVGVKTLSLSFAPLKVLGS